MSKPGEMVQLLRDNYEEQLEEYRLLRNKFLVAVPGVNLDKERDLYALWKSDLHLNSIIDAEREPRGNKAMKPIDVVIDVAKALQDWDGSPEQAAEKLGAACKAVQSYTHIGLDPFGSGEHWHGELMKALDEIERLRNAAAPLQEAWNRAERPRIVCLCGSSRFIELFATLSWTLERDLGVIVLGLHYLPPSYPGLVTDHLAEAEGVADKLDELHKRKIDLSDEILVLNVDGYIGESTRSEIAYAEAHGKPVRYLEARAALAAEGKT
jgi:hypothetical protein